VAYPIHRKRDMPPADGKAQTRINHQHQAPATKHRRGIFVAQFLPDAGFAGKSALYLVDFLV